MNFIFRNRKIFWDISKWNKGQKKWDGGSIKEFVIVALLFNSLLTSFIYIPPLIVEKI